MKIGFDILAEILFPSRCYRCKKYDTYLCVDCYTHILSFPYPACFHCNEITHTGKLSKECRNSVHINRLYTCADYADKYISELIKDLKYKRAKKLSEDLAQYGYWWIKEKKFIEDFEPSKDKVFTCVPGYIKKEKERGFNHAEEIAKRLSEISGIPYEKGLLLKHKSTARQVEMSTREKRVLNIQNAYTANTESNIENKTIILVDDVITTGTTMKECAKTLKKAGAKEVWAFAIAKD